MDVKVGESCEWRGRWKSIDGSFQHSGTLVISDSGDITLHVDGALHGKSLAEIMKAAMNAKTEISHVQGILENGHPITLLNLYISNTQVNTSYGVQVKYLVQRAIFGGIVTSDQKFKSVEYTFTSVAEWIGLRELAVTMPMTEEGQVSIEHSLMKPVVFEIPSQSLQLRISQRCGNSPDSTISTVARTLRVWPVISLSKMDGQGLGIDEAHRFAHEIRDLLLIITGHRVTIEKVTLVGREKLEDGSERPVGFSYTWSSRHPESSKQIHQQPLYDMAYCEQHIPTVFDKWFSIGESARDSLNLLVATVYSGSMFDHQEFLFVVQALESWLRQSDGGLYMDQAEYDNRVIKIKELIGESFDSDLAASLKSRVKYGNEFSLRKRLRNSIEALPEDVVSTLPIKPISNFVNQVVDTRNYFTHWTDELRQLALSGRDLYGATAVLKVLCVILVLQELGFDPKDAVERVKALSSEFNLFDQ